jgi:alpha-glucosidase
MRIWKALLPLCALGCGWVTGARAWTSAGSVVAYTLGTNSADFVLTSGAVARVQFLDPGILRVRVNPAGSLSSRLSPALAPQGLLPPDSQITESNGAVWLVTSRMRVAVIESPFQVVAWNPDGSLITADATNAVFWDPGTGQIVASKNSPADEHYFGLGERGGPIDRRGRSLELRNTDNSGYGELTDPLYQSYPFYYGLRGGKAYGIFLDNPAFPFFDFDAANPGQVLFGANAGELNYYLLAGPGPFDVANAYARLTGCNPLPPEWTLGYHHSRYGWQSAQQILDIAAQLRAQDFPCDAVWFDIDYMDQRHQFTWDPAGFPDPAGLNQELASMGFHCVYINEPCLLQSDPLWSYFDAEGDFVRNTSGQSLVGSIWFGDVSFIDFTRSATRTWYAEQLKSFLSVGISGLWLDLNEPADNFMPDAVYDFDGDPRSDLESRDLYALLEAQTAYQAQLELRTNTRPWNFSRSGYSGIQRYAHTWGGDEPSTFDSLRVAIEMSISMGLSGQNQFGHDTGGFLGSPSGELFTRWLEFSCFTPLFRNHSINTSSNREPWSFGEPYTTVIRQIIQRRYRWLPYLYTLFEEASRTGRPVLAPTFFYAQGDPATYTQDTDYLLGPNVLVAPVFEAGASNRTVYLPAGNDWIDYWSDARYGGGQSIVVPAPLGQTPLLIRAGAILVRGSVMPYVGAAADSTLTADVYPSGDSSFTLYEDDGESFDFERGLFLRTELHSQWALTSGQVSISRVQGAFQPPARSWLVNIHEVPVPPAGVRLNGTPLPAVTNEAGLDGMTQGWFYASAGNRLTLKAQDNLNPLMFDVLVQASVATQPVSQTAYQGSSVTFTAGGAGSSPLTYQWFFNGTNLLAGQTHSMLTLTNVQPVKAGDYSVVIANDYGASTSHVATLSVVLGGLALAIDAQRQARLQFTVDSFLGYTVQYRGDLGAAPWLIFTNLPPQTATGLVQQIDPSPAFLPQRFYRVVTPIQPASN